jgi:hypothetical protein
MTPRERDDRFVVFDASTASLRRVSDGSDVYRQNADNIEPRIGCGVGRLRRRAHAGSRSLRGDGRTAVGERGRPFSRQIRRLGTPLTLTGSVPVDTAFAVAAGGEDCRRLLSIPLTETRSPTGWNVNLQREVARGTSVMIGYVGARAAATPIDTQHQPTDRRNAAVPARVAPEFDSAGHAARQHHTDRRHLANRAIEPCGRP